MFEYAFYISMAFNAVFLVAIVGLLNEESGRADLLNAANAHCDELAREKVALQETVASLERTVQFWKDQCDLGSDLAERDRESLRREVLRLKAAAKKKKAKVSK